MRTAVLTTLKLISANCKVKVREQGGGHEESGNRFWSGGLDSATVLAIARAQGYELYALSFSYGQRHIWELEAAARVAAFIGVASHRTAKIDLRIFGGSALTDDIAVPKGRAVDEMSHGIPVTYVPARNTIFLSFALAWAEVLGSSDIFIGVNALDYSGYPTAVQNLSKPMRQWRIPRHQGRRRRPPVAQDSHATHCDVEGRNHRQRNRVGRRLQPHQQLLRSIGNGRSMRPM